MLPSDVRIVEAIGFDLGDTLLYYEGVPLNWSGLYAPALTAVGQSCGVVTSELTIEAACSVLRQYNTRMNPRKEEVAADLIFGAVLEAWNVPVDGPTLRRAIESFFRFFQQRACCYPETIGTLSDLRRFGIPVGILTDVAYGMPAELVALDLYSAQLHGLVDVMLSSVEVGWRKPVPIGFARLTELLGTATDKLLYVGNERKDVEGALAAGCIAVLLDREGHGEDFGQHKTIRRLDDLLDKNFEVARSSISQKIQFRLVRLECSSKDVAY